MKNILLSTFTLLGSLAIYAQNNVGIGTLAPDVNAILELKSTNQGFLPPRLKEIQRDAMVNPAAGMLIFNIDKAVMEYWNGICWLQMYAENCSECYFQIAGTSTAGSLDRVVSDSVFTDITITQTNGTPQNLAFVVAPTLPAGVTAYVTPNPVQSNGGTARLVVKASIFAPDGTYPVILQAYCGGSLQTFIYSVTIEPCYKITATANVNNLDMLTEFTNTYFAPSVPVCVILEVQPGVILASAASTQPSVTSGIFPAGSLVGVINNGDIIGHGGDGGTGRTIGNPIPGYGKDGGDGLSLDGTIRSEIYNDPVAHIYGGGGGGGAAAYDLSLTLGPITVGVYVGGGGGGGAGDGLGGNVPATTFGIFEYVPGQDASNGITSIGTPGEGGEKTTSISRTISVVTITLKPVARGGDGGTYGYPGDPGSFVLEVAGSITINIPILGPVTTQIAQFPVNVPPNTQGGLAGYAVKRTAGVNITNLPDNYYTGTQLKGKVGQ